MSTDVSTRPGLNPTARASRSINWGLVFSVVVGIVIVISILSPLVPLGIWSFGSSWFFPDLLPSKLSMRAWEYVFSSTARTGEALLQGTVIALVATALSMVISVPAGRAWACTHFGAGAWYCF